MPLSDEEIIKRAILYLCVVLNVNGQYATIPPSSTVVGTQLAGLASALGFDATFARNFISGVLNGADINSFSDVAQAFDGAVGYTGVGCPRDLSAIVTLAQKFTS